MPAARAKLLVLGRIRGLIPWRAALSCGSTAAIGAAIGGVLVESSPRRALTYLVGVFGSLAGREGRVGALQQEDEAARGATGGGWTTDRGAGRLAHKRDGVEPRGDDAKRDADGEAGVEEAVVVKLEISAPPPPR